MDKAQFKQRIVGAIVLVALGVIFIPIILNQEGEDSPISGTNIPQKPESLQELASQQPPAMPVAPAVDTNKPQIVDEDIPVPVPVPSQAEVNAPEKPADPPTIAEPVGEATPAVASPGKKEETKTATKTRAWVVQVASFSERSKALKLRDRLRKAKYTAFVESVSSSKGTLYRVRVGPVVKREKAEALKTKIAKDFKLKDALVMSHP